MNLKNRVRGFNAYDKKILTWLFLWHIGTGIGYFFYVSSAGGDALAYWNAPRDEGWDVVAGAIQNKSAAGYIFLINYFPSNILNLSFFTGSMIYAIFGYAGFVFLYKIIKETIPDYRQLAKVKVLKIPIFPYFLFLPNLNFWTSGVGKDTILFFCMAIFIAAIKDVNRRFGYIILSAILSIFIRPHILLFLLTALGLAIVFDARIKVYNKIFLYVIFIVVFLAFLPYVMDFANVESLDTATIETYGEKKAGALSSREKIASAVDISNYPYPLKVVTFLFRPFFIDMTTLSGQAASVENLIFLVFFITVLLKKPLSGFYRGNLAIKTLLFFFIIGSLVFPIVLGNLGIIIRQKTPFVIAFILFGYWSIINYYSLKVQSTLNKKPISPVFQNMEP